MGLKVLSEVFTINNNSIMLVIYIITTSMILQYWMSITLQVTQYKS